jgi:hypothetical protein
MQPHKGAVSEPVAAQPDPDPAPAPVSPPGPDVLRPGLVPPHLRGCAISDGERADPPSQGDANSKLPVQVELEPNDYAHRNYCAEGAIAVLLSTWTTALPSLDAIGVTAHVIESYGTTGDNAVGAINTYLQQITGTTNYAYTGTHVTSLPVFESQLETDLSGMGRFTTAGHGSPVLVHVMTATLPGWGGYQAQHMISVFGYSFAAGTPAGDTVTYVESAGSVAGYNGPQVETISLAALWTAMQNYNTDITTDLVTVIS